MTGMAMLHFIRAVAAAQAAPAAGAVAAAMLSAMWQGALLVAAVALALRFTPGLSAALRTRLWLAVMAVLLVLPAALPSVRRALSASPVLPARVPAVHPLHLGGAWSLWLTAAWLVLSSARLIQLAASAIRLRRVARAAIPIAARAEVASLLRRGGRPVELCVSPEIGRPSVVGFLRPRILLPAGLLEALTPAELHQVLLHEMEHLRRHDDWTNLAQKLALVALPLDPALFWVERRLCAERELACDDAVVQATGTGAMRSSAARKAYAACLVSLAEHSIARHAAALALGAWERQSELSRRVHRILRRPEPAMQPAAARRAAAGLLGGALLAAALLAATPQLVSFAPPDTAVADAQLPLGDAPAGLATIGPQQTPDRRATLRPAMARMDGPQPRLTLASATLPPVTTGANHSAARQQLPAGRERRRVRLTGRLPGVRQGRAPYDTTPRLRQVSLENELLLAVEPLILLSAAPVPTPVLTLTDFTTTDRFSPSFAAVPVRGGWLFVQL